MMLSSREISIKYINMIKHINYDICRGYIII